MKKSVNEDIAGEIISDYERLSADRSHFETQWKEIAERVIPAQRDKFQSKGFKGEQGQKQTEFLFDSTAAIALNRFTAILDSLLTPRNGTWHRIVGSDPALNKIREVKLWFEEVNRLLFKYRYAPKANFASQNQQNYASLGAYGSGCMFVDKLVDPSEKGLRYRNIHLGEVYFAENHQGMVDKSIRYYQLTARHAYQKWGDSLPDKIKNNINKEEIFWFIHCVKPRLDRDPERVDYKGMDFSSYNVSVDGKKVLNEGGFTTFPYAISRYEQHSGEVYGRSPSMAVLPAIKTLNEEKKTLLKQGHRATDPVLLGPDDGVLDAMDLMPGAFNPGGVSADGRPLVHALPTGNVAIGKDMMDDERLVINDAFLITIFQILTETPAMSATEVLERTKEKGILLAPTIGRQQSEYLGPMIEREIDVLVAQRMLPPMPQALREAGGEFQIVYDSPLSRAQRAEEAAGLMRTVETTLNVVNITQNPEPLDYFDWDVIIPELSEIQGVPFRWMKSPEVVKQIRAARAQQAAQQQMIQAAPGAAALMKAGNQVVSEG